MHQNSSIRISIPLLLKKHEVTTRITPYHKHSRPCTTRTRSILMKSWLSTRIQSKNKRNVGRHKRNMENMTAVNFPLRINALRSNTHSRRVSRKATKWPIVDRSRERRPVLTPTGPLFRHYSSFSPTVDRCQCLRLLRALVTTSISTASTVGRRQRTGRAAGDLLTWVGVSALSSWVFLGSSLREEFDEVGRIACSTQRRLATIWGRRIGSNRVWEGESTGLPICWRLGT